MQVWLISFLLLLALFRGLDWLHSLSLPLPLVLVGGAILAIVSNDSLGVGLPWPINVRSAPSSLEAQHRPTEQQPTTLP